MRFQKLEILFIVVFFNAVSSFFAQNQTEDVSKFINQLTSIWNENQKIDFKTLIVDSTLKLTQEPFKIVEQNNQLGYKSLLLKQNKLQQEINRKNLGLHATVAYQENFNSPIVDPEEIVVFKRRAITGIDWDILNNGFYENRLKNKILKAEYALIEKKHNVDKLFNTHSKHIEQIIRHFNEKKIQILKSRESLNKQQSEIVEKLWAIKHITKVDYLKVLQNTTDVKAQFALYKNFNDVVLSDNQKIEIDLPILDIIISDLFQKANFPISDTTKINYDDLARYNSSYLRDVNLKVYSRYNYYDVYNASSPNRSYVSVGMNLSLPLAFNQKEKRESYLLQQEITNFKPNNSDENLEVFLLNSFYEYQYKLKQFKNLYHKRLVFEELLRTERAKQQLNDLEFNPNAALYILDDYWSNAIELLDLKQDMYKILANIKTKTPNINLSDYTKTLTLDNLNISSSNPPFKAVYIWSDAFKNNSIEVVNEYCKVNEFNNLLVSYNFDKKYLSQLTDFIQKNQSNNIHLLIGSNKLLQTGLSGFLDTLKSNINLKLIKGIHLDIEPHALDDFKENKTVYFDKYLSLLIQAKNFVNSNNLELSVSIPLNYPENILKEINNVCNHVYLMAYENVNPDFIAKKVAEEKNIFNDKIVIALRTKDFKNRVEMNECIKLTGFSKSAFHDLDDLIRFDNNSINNKEEEGR